MSEKLFEEWRRHPADLAALSRWVSEMQGQSAQAAAIQRLAPLAEEPLEDAVAAGVYAALVTLALDLGRANEANEWVNRLHGVEPRGFRTPYLRGRILQQLNRLEEAKGYFYEAAKRDQTQADAWKALLICCSKTRDFERALRVIQQLRLLPWTPAWRRFWYYKQGCIYQQMANFSLAMVCFTEVVLDCAASGIPREAANVPRLSQVPPAAPIAALRDAVDLLEAQGLRPFPTAGTLLGWWREGTFLPHDKDIDIMLPPGSDWDRALSALSESSAFVLVPSEMGYSNFQALVHRETRLIIDLSHHEELADGNVQGVWRIPGLPDEQCRRTVQAPYELVRDHGLGGEYWRPEDPDRFLTELYGDWRTPMVNFDTTISGLHLVGFPDTVRCYAYNRLANRLSDGNREKGLAYAAQILEKDPVDPLANHIRSLFANKAERPGDA